MPDRIGRYRVQRRLGSGSFATVWLAEDAVLDTFVAIKVLADNWSEHLDVRARFVEEARILRRADSDRLVRVLDIGGLPDGRPYSVMTYADRGTLADLLAPGPLPIDGALALGAEIARGVAVLHEIGVIHRDLKPSNVLFGRDGTGRERVLVADLGLAKAVAHGSGFTVTAGSPGYMAPEQARPGGGIDVRADVYALGALLYHTLTGAPPSTEPPVPPSARRPEVTAQLDRIVLRALHREPEQRWPSAEALAVALDGARAEAPVDPIARVRARPAVPRQAAGGRHRRVLLAAAAVVALAGAGAGIGTAFAVGSADRWVRVTDATRTISVEVPPEWAGQLQDAGWTPRGIGVVSGHFPGLAVAPDLASWREPGSETPGVFIGAVPTTLGAESPVPDVCGEATGGGYRTGRLGGSIGRSRHCGGTAVSISTAMLTVDDGPFGVFVQIKQTGETDHTDRILASLQVRPA